ncbi:MAG: hypothetical protein U9O96_05715 [Candidatus Thermoplasmatota archaeon]|nr:hypothetical protein [Candidatus Thermoplasmatota archaeon]
MRVVLSLGGSLLSTEEPKFIEKIGSVWGDHRDSLDYPDPSGHLPWKAHEPMS